MPNKSQKRAKYEITLCTAISLFMLSLQRQNQTENIAQLSWENLNWESIQIGAISWDYARPISLARKFERCYRWSKKNLILTLEKNPPLKKIWISSDSKITFAINLAFSFTQVWRIHSFVAEIASEATFMPSLACSSHQFSNEHLK